LLFYSFFLLLLLFLYSIKKSKGPRLILIQSKFKPHSLIYPATTLLVLLPKPQGFR